MDFPQYLTDKQALARLGNSSIRLDGLVAEWRAARVGPLLSPHPSTTMGLNSGGFCRRSFLRLLLPAAPARLAL
jgi:hypothetical protein